MTKDIWEEIINCGAYFQELDWYAIDKDGYLGMFLAIMHAPVPKKVKQSYDDYIRLKQLIASLPKSTSFVLTTTEHGDFSDWTFTPKRDYMHLTSKMYTGQLQKTNTT